MLAVAAAIAAVTIITSAGAANAAPAASTPTASRIVTVQMTGSLRSQATGHLIRPDGTGLRQLPNTEGGEYPSWSPDGTRIAFNSNLTGDHLMFVAEVDGSKVVGPVGAGEGWQVDWSPDKRSILFTSHRDYPDPKHRDLYVMRPDGSDVRRLTYQGAEAPAWSPDGQHIVFSYGGLFVINANGTGVTPLPTGVGETELPDWTG